MKSFRISGQDGLELHTVSWDQVESPKAIVQISHGMAEHILRYDGFAKHLNERGFIVYGHDHRGHGATAVSAEDLGYFSDENGWDKLIDDLYAVTCHIKASHPELPLFMFGHSMGSFALRHYLGKYGYELSGAIISGTGHNPNWLNWAAYQVAKIEKKIKGKRHRSHLMTSLSFGSFNKQFKPNHTEFDWLSRDEIEVYKYIEDPLCGLVFTSGFFEDFLGGIIELTKKSTLAAIPKERPYLFISGMSDPLAQGGKAIREVAGSFKAAGIQDVSVKLYPEARHELTNELDKAAVFKDIADWLDTKLEIVHK